MLLRVQIMRPFSAAVRRLCAGPKSARGLAQCQSSADLLLKYSTDGGRNWSPQRVIWDDGPNTCGNPCPVLDEQTGTVWLLVTRNDGRENESAIKAKKGLDTRTV